MISTLFFALALNAAEPSAVPSPPLPDKVEFNQHIRPIFSDTCFHCHGPDLHNVKAKLQLHDFAHAIAPLDSDPKLHAIVPGKPEESEAVKRIFSADPDEIMPPPDAHKTLSNYQKQLIRKWVTQGAEYQQHWSYQPVRRPAGLPAATSLAADLLIAKGLKAVALTASPQASREQLIRRLAFDLTGLPPRPALLQKYLADTAADALERCTDELLASPAFGERLAVHWLDVVRAGDTAGYHSDQDRPIEPYRDYLIRAFNADKPFDQFTREQLAGDLIPGGDEEQRIAACYNRLNSASKEGGAQPGEYLAKYSADRVRNTAQAWLGATLGCAECHNHKYDPYTQKDFYAFAAFFADIDEVGVNDITTFGDYSTENSLFHPELITGLPPATAATQEKLWQERRTEIDLSRRAVVNSLFAACSIKNLVAAEGSVFTVQADGSVLAKSTTAGREDLRLSLEVPANTRFLRLQFKPLATGQGHSFAPNGDFFIHHLDISGTDGRPRAVNGYFADRWNPSYHPDNLLRSNYGWSPGPEEPERDHFLLIELKEAIAGLVTLHLECNSGYPSQIPAHFGVAAAAAVVDYSNHRAELARIDAELRTLRSKGRPVLSVRRVAPRQIRILDRGNWMDISGEVVQPATPACLTATPPQDKQLDRLDLANWMTSRDNPLTARVFVNRIWALLLGSPLSNKAGDLGSQGDFPSNPELLDLLAADFMKDWSVKNLIRSIVSTAAYRRTCSTEPQLLAKDPANRFYARQSPRRLEAEFIRDHALVLGGLLVEEIGGAKSYPYQPPGFYDSINFPKREYPVSRDKQQWRRGVYMHWQRSFLHPFLQNFDAPNRQDCTPLRARSNTPLQGLSLLNDPQFVEAAAFFAQRIVREGQGDDASHIRWAVQTALGRGPNDVEVAALLQVRQLDLASYGQDPATATKLLGAGLARYAPEAQLTAIATWTGVARALINSSEFITVY